MWRLAAFRFRSFPYPCSTKRTKVRALAVLALLSKPAGELVSAWRTGSVNDTPSPEAAERLRANMAIAQAIGLKGTPTFIWRKSDGAEGRIDGIPMSMDALVSSIGS